MFEAQNGNFDIQKSHINNKGEYVITSGMTNNGILGKTDIPAKIFESSTITVDMFGFSFYRQFKYKMVTHARVFSLKPNFNMSKNQGLFFANSLHFLNDKFGYENMCSWEKVKNEKILLPIKNGEIDFDFMESFISELEAYHISELEAYHISELEAYLLAIGLKDYALTEAEEKAIEDFKNLDWKEYNLNNIFEIKSSNKRFDANKVNILENGDYPYIVRTSLNNGQKGFINENKLFLNEGNTISFGQDTATMFYQEKPYFTGDKIKILKARYNSFDKNNAQFFLSSMMKSFSCFSWGSSRFNEDTIKNQSIVLPIKNNEIDFKFMETFISAIQKLVIKDVVLYADRKISQTKEVVKK